MFVPFSCGGLSFLVGVPVVQWPQQFAVDKRGPFLAISSVTGGIHVEAEEMMERCCVVREAFCVSSAVRLATHLHAI